MFPAPPRPPARCKISSVNPQGIQRDSVNTTHYHYFLLPWFLWFGFGWLGREKKLGTGHIAGEPMRVVVETEKKTRDEAKVSGA